MPRITPIYVLLSLVLLFGFGNASAGRALQDKPGLQESQAERRLLQVYTSIGAGQLRQALAQAEGLVRDHPNFQLAQLVYGDLLTARARPLQAFGDVSSTPVDGAAEALAAMREESLLRVRAHRETPAPGMVPTQFLQLSEGQRHAIAIDTSKARLYLFENGPAGLKLVEHYYVSIGKLGVDKALEGDQRTPLGVYFIVSNLDPKSLRDFYGAGALPINYPNAYDARVGRTGRGIWIHGAPPEQFARAPKASDGCVVLANPDLRRVLGTVEPGATPVVIARSLQWVRASQLEPARQAFRGAVNDWIQARSSGDQARLRGMYTQDASIPPPSGARGQAAHPGGIAAASAMSDLSFFSWKAEQEIMVTTFKQARDSRGAHDTTRQYWTRDRGKWRIFYERVIASSPGDKRRTRAS